MSKQAFPGIKTGNGLLAKIISVVTVLMLLVIVVKHPGDAAAWVKGGFSFISDVIDGAVAFFRDVSS